MTVRWNLVAGLASSMVSAAVAMLVVPFYLAYLGVEAYGIVGFYAAAQGFLAVLDVGFTPTMNRETARAHAEGDVDGARDLLHSLSVFTWSSACGIALLFVALSSTIATEWLRPANLPTGTVSFAVMLIGFVIAVRWPMGVYTGTLVGAQRVTWLSAINIVMTVVSNGGAILVLHAYAPTIEAFFCWQLLANVVWMALIRRAAWRALGNGGGRARFSFPELRRVWTFSLTMAATGVMGAILTYSDRLVVSRMLPLRSLGYYTVATQLAAVLALFVVPTVNVIYPALTRLVMAEDEAALRRSYRDGSRMLAAVLFPLAGWIALFAVPIVTLWTGDANIAAQVAPVLQILVVGNALNGIMYFPYSLQMAAGAAHLTAMTASFLLAALFPALYILTARYGATGAAAAWALTNFLYILVGTPLTHRFFLKGAGLAWLIRDVSLPMLVAAATTGAAGLLLLGTKLPVLAVVVLGALAVPVSAAIVVASSPGLMAHLKSVLPRHRPT